MAAVGSWHRMKLSTRRVHEPHDDGCISMCYVLRPIIFILRTVQTEPKSSRMMVLFVRKAECGAYAGYKSRHQVTHSHAFNRLVYVDVVQWKRSQACGECCQSVDCDLASCVPILSYSRGTWAAAVVWINHMLLQCFRLMCAIHNFYGRKSLTRERDDNKVQKSKWRRRRRRWQEQ